MPAVIIVAFSIVLVYAIVQSNSRMSTFYTHREIETFKKDVQLSIMAIVMNVLIIAGSFPIIIIGYISKAFVFSLCICFYLCICTFKLYFFLAFSSLFREAFVSIVQKRTTPARPRVENNEENEML